VGVVKDSALTARTRTEALAAMATDPGLDVLVIGGGVVGAGTALDAVSRGLRTGLVEAADWAAGASSRSSGLLHGDRTALEERAVLADRIAPHLVRPQPFLIPLRVPIVERVWGAVGVGAYDLAARVAGGRLPIQRHYDKAATLGIFPDIRPSRLTGAIRFYDARVDGVRLVIDLVRTAVGYGALAASRARVVGLRRNGDVVTGAVVRDEVDGQEHVIRARQVIAATGVWSRDIEGLLGRPRRVLRPEVIRGVHVVVPRERIRGRVGLVIRTERGRLFLVPQADHWVIGAAGAPWPGGAGEVRAEVADVDEILDRVDRVLRSRLTRADVVAVEAGLRTVALRGDRAAGAGPVPAVLGLAPGLTVAIGDALGTYRQVAGQAVDRALGPERTRTRRSITDRIQLVGAVGYEVARAQADSYARRMGWTPARAEHLLGRYGAQVEQIAALVAERPDLGRPLDAAPRYLRAEVVHAVGAEGALHLDDVLSRRVPIGVEQRDGGAGVLGETVALMAGELGWDVDRARAEREAYVARCRAVGEAAGLVVDGPPPSGRA